MDNVTEFLGIMVVGAALSAVLEYLSRKYDPSSGKMKFFTILGAVIVGGGYVWIRSTPWFSTIITVLTSASAVYALILKK